MNADTIKKNRAMMVQCLRLGYFHAAARYARWIAKLEGREFSPLP